ncbi:MAG: thioredoxin [Clostridia bacterium]|nr:thioredoxin [Clostridia bacterium]
MKALQPPPHHLKAVRVGLYILGTALVVLGVINGGLRDVMYKAITICTECIGLG